MVNFRTYLTSQLKAAVCGYVSLQIDFSQTTMDTSAIFRLGLLLLAVTRITGFLTRNYDPEFVNFTMDPDCDKSYFKSAEYVLENLPNDKIKLNALLSLSKHLHTKSFGDTQALEKSGDTYVKTMYHYKTSMSEGMEMCKNIKMCQDLLNHSNLPEDISDGIVPGNYVVTDYVFDMKQLPVVFPGAKEWKIVGQLFTEEGGKKICGGVGYAQIRQKSVG